LQIIQLFFLKRTNQMCSSSIFKRMANPGVII